MTIDGRDLHDVLAKEPGPGSLDVCGLAAELPADNLCSLICDPDAMAARMIKDGWPTGECVEMRCDLPNARVNVGICLPVPSR